MKQSLCIILLLLSSFLLSGQDGMQFDYKQEDKKLASYQTVYFNLHLDIVGGINNLLRSNDYPEMDEFGYQYGIRFGAQRGKKLAGLVDFGYYTRGTNESNNTNNFARITGWSAGIGAEYFLIKTKFMFISPMFLVSYNRYTLNMVQNPGGNTIDGLINSDYQEYKFRSIQYPVQAGLNISGSFNVANSKIGVVLAAGYILNYQNDNWATLQGSEVTDKINLSSPYASFGLFSSIN